MVRHTHEHPVESPSEALVRETERRHPAIVPPVPRFLRCVDFDVRVLPPVHNRGKRENACGGAAEQRDRESREASGLTVIQSSAE